jgi:hypothetical protein
MEKMPHWFLYVCLMVFNATFNNISATSWRFFFLVEETRGPRENHRPVASHWQTHNIRGDRRSIYDKPYMVKEIQYF